MLHRIWNQTLVAMQMLLSIFEFTPCRVLCAAEFSITHRGKTSVLHRTFPLKPTLTTALQKNTLITSTVEVAIIVMFEMSSSANRRGMTSEISLRADSLSTHELGMASGTHTSQCRRPWEGNGHEATFTRR